MNRPASRQRGEILLFTLLLLLLLLLGSLLAMREGITATWLAGNNLAQQKNVQTADIALRMMESRMLAASGGMPLELAATGQAWFRDVAGGTAAPDDTYWADCLGHANAAQRCAQVALTVGGNPLPFTALAVVQPTGRSDATACGLAQYQAIYYDVFIRIRESSGATAATTETIYRICTLS